MSGREGLAARRTGAFIDRLQTLITERALDVEIVRWDERLSSTAAERAMTQLGVARERKKQVVDQIAATHILEAWLRGLKHP
jgi:putative Holliday junction resolvase